MNTDKIAEKIIKIVLIIAGFSLAFLIVSPFFIFPEEESTLETIMLIPAIPVVMSVVILVALGRSRYNTILPTPLRVIGLILFTLWILSFFIDNPFR